jgi:hypothetical protein
MRFKSVHSWQAKYIKLCIKKVYLIKALEFVILKCLYHLWDLYGFENSAKS